MNNIPTRLRYDIIDTVTEWMWLQGENGAFDGPSQDWISHKACYLKYCKQFRSVVCAGGNQGMHPRLFSDFFSKVYTFEPDHMNFHCLVNNCQKENVIKINAALGDKHRMINLCRPNMENTGMHTICLDDVGIIPQLMIDDFYFEDLDLIQLDIEGYELFALRGAINTIIKNKPVISCERGNDEISNFLKSFGYERVDQSVSDTFYVCNN